MEAEEENIILEITQIASRNIIKDVDDSEDVDEYPFFTVHQLDDCCSCYCFFVLLMNEK